MLQLITACALLNTGEGRASAENFAAVVLQTLEGHLFYAWKFSKYFTNINSFNLPNSPYEIGTIIIFAMLQMRKLRHKKSQSYIAVELGTESRRSGSRSVLLTSRLHCRSAGFVCVPCVIVGGRTPKHKHSRLVGNRMGMKTDVTDTGSP